MLKMDRMINRPSDANTRFLSSLYSPVAAVADTWGNVVVDRGMDASRLFIAAPAVLAVILVTGWLTKIVGPICIQGVCRTRNL